MGGNRWHRCLEVVDDGLVSFAEVEVLAVADPVGGPAADILLVGPGRSAVEPQDHLVAVNFRAGC